MKIKKQYKSPRKYKIVNDDGEVCFKNLNAAFAKSLAKIRKDYLKKMRAVK